MTKKAVRLGKNTNSTEISPNHCYLRREITNRSKSNSCFMKNE